jgi:hypothetical protein
VSNSHSGSSLILSNRIIPVDNNTVFLGHMDITANDVLYGIEPTSNISTLRDGKFGGGIAVEEGTTNLWTGAYNIYNNYASNGQMTASLVALNETYMGATVYRLSMTPISANAVTSMQNDMWSHGVFGSSRTYNSGNTYMASIYWRPVNKSDIVVGGTASNIAGWTDVGTYIQNDGWRRSVSKWYDIADRTDNKFWSFKNPSAVANETIMVDWVAPQIEQKLIATSYVNGTRGLGILKYPADYINSYEGTVSLWYKPHYPSSYVTAQSNSPKLLQIGDYYGNSSITLWNFINSFTVYVKGNSDSGWSASKSIGSIFTQDEWIMITVTWKNTDWKIYKNGVLAGSFTSTQALGQIAGNNLYVGGDGGDGGSSKGVVANGTIDELRIDKIARTDEEIASWYISNQPFYPKGIYRLAY